MALVDSVDVDSLVEPHAVKTDATANAYIIFIAKLYSWVTNLHNFRKATKESLAEGLNVCIIVTIFKINGEFNILYRRN